MSDGRKWSFIGSKIFLCINTNGKQLKRRRKHFLNDYNFIIAVPFCVLSCEICKVLARLMSLLTNFNDNERKKFLYAERRSQPIVKLSREKSLAFSLFNERSVALIHKWYKKLKKNIFAHAHSTSTSTVEMKLKCAWNWFDLEN